MIWTIPNLLTLARLVAAPAVALIFATVGDPLAGWLAFWVFVVAALTDFLDGWLARRLGQESALGRMLDPIADKAMVLIALLVLVVLTDGAEAVWIPAVIIVFREVLVSGMRETIGSAGLAVTWIGKTKTTAQLVAIGALLLANALAAAGPVAAGSGLFPVGGAIGVLGMAGLYVATALTVISGVDYFLKAVAYIRTQED